MLLKRFINCFSEAPRLKPLTAYKYLRSISETALLYKPLKMKSLPP